MHFNRKARYVRDGQPKDAGHSASCTASPHHFLFSHFWVAAYGPRTGPGKGQSSIMCSEATHGSWFFKQIVPQNISGSLNFIMSVQYGFQGHDWLESWLVRESINGYHCKPGWCHKPKSGSKKLVIESRYGKSVQVTWWNRWNKSVVQNPFSILKIITFLDKIISHK